MTDKYNTLAINLPEEDEKEQWLPAPGFEDRYEISSFGNIRNKKTQILRKINYDHYGYPIVCLKRYDEKTRQQKVCFLYLHRLVCEAFNGLPTPENNVCDHIDRCIVNNYYRNLHWTNHRGNKLNSKEPNKRQIFLNSTPIVFLDTMGNFIARYDNILEAHKETGISIQQIQHNLRGSRAPFKDGYFRKETDYLDSKKNF